MHTAGTSVFLDKTKELGINPKELVESLTEITIEEAFEKGLLRQVGRPGGLVLYRPRPKDRIEYVAMVDQEQDQIVFMGAREHAQPVAG